MTDHSALIERLEMLVNPGELVVGPNMMRAALEEAAAALRDLTEWRDIATAPKDGTEIVAWDRSDRIICHWHKSPSCAGGWVTHWETVSGYDVGWNTVHPTHWLPLPSAPNQAKEAD